MKRKRIRTAHIAMDPLLCIACWKCVETCPKKVIGKTDYFLHKYVVFKNADVCTGCGRCIKTCPNGVFFKVDKTVYNHKMNKGILFCIERLLPIVFLASAVTGIGLHIAGHGTNHEAWHNWGAAHISTSFFWLLSVVAHIRRHRLWYNTLLSHKIAHKHWIALFLSILFPIVTITGIWLMAYVKEAHSSIGLLHYKFGIILLILTLIHLFHRK